MLVGHCLNIYLLSSHVLVISQYEMANKNTHGFYILTFIFFIWFFQYSCLYHCIFVWPYIIIIDYIFQLNWFVLYGICWFLFFFLYRLFIFYVMVWFAFHLIFCYSIIPIYIPGFHGWPSSWCVTTT